MMEARQQVMEIAHVEQSHLHHQDKAHEELHGGFELEDEESDGDVGRQRRDELGRPQTPEPSRMGMRDDDKT